MRPLILAVLAVGLVGAGGQGEQLSGPQHRPAAEPAIAPALTAAPAGRVVPIGAQPEGITVDPASHVVAVAVHDPAALVLVDGRTGAGRQRIPLPGTVRHLQIQAGGTVLVPVEPANELLRIAAATGNIVSRAMTGRSPHDAAGAADGRVFVADEGGASVSVVRDSAVEHTFSGAAQPGGVAVVGPTVGVVDVGADTLTTFDAD